MKKIQRRDPNRDWESEGKQKAAEYERKHNCKKQKRTCIKKSETRLPRSR